MTFTVPFWFLIWKMLHWFSYDEDEEENNKKFKQIHWKESLLLLVLWFSRIQCNRWNIPSWECYITAIQNKFWNSSSRYYYIDGWIEAIKSMTTNVILFEFCLYIQVTLYTCTISYFIIYLILILLSISVTYFATEEV